MFETWFRWFDLDALIGDGGLVTFLMVREIFVVYVWTDMLPGFTVITSRLGNNQEEKQEEVDV